MLINSFASAGIVIKSIMGSRFQRASCGGVGRIRLFCFRVALCRLPQKVSVQLTDQIRDHHHELPAQIDLVFVRRQINRLPHHALITPRERDTLIVIAQLAQNVPHPIGTAMRLLNRLESGCFGDFPRPRALQQPALERAAAHRALRVNLAQLAVETRARLGKAWKSGTPFQRQTERGQARVVVAFLQTHVSEEHAVAAQRASRAKQRNGIGSFDRGSVHARHTHSTTTPAVQADVCVARRGHPGSATKVKTRRTPTDGSRQLLQYCSTR